MNIKYFGIGIDQLLLDNPLVVRSIEALAASSPNASLKVYTSDRYGDEPLEWFINITSPRGRRSAILTQRVKGGAVLISNNVVTI